MVKSRPYVSNQAMVLSSTPDSTFLSCSEYIKGYRAIYSCLAGFDETKLLVTCKLKYEISALSQLILELCLAYPQSNNKQPGGSSGVFGTERRRTLTKTFTDGYSCREGIPHQSHAPQEKKCNI